MWNGYTQVTQATTEECVRNLVEEHTEMMFDSGFTKPPTAVALSDKEHIIKALCLHHIILKCKAELDQIKDGLRTLGVATAIEVLPEAFQCLFTAAEDLKMITPGR